MELNQNDQLEKDIIIRLNYLERDSVRVPATKSELPTDILKAKNEYNYWNFSKKDEKIRTIYSYTESWHNGDHLGVITRTVPQLDLSVLQRMKELLHYECFKKIMAKIQEEQTEHALRRLEEELKG